MAAAKKKHITVVKNSTLFDINEWIDTKRQSLIRCGSWSDSEMKYTLVQHKKKVSCFFLTVYFKKKILRLMDSSPEPRIMVMQHKHEYSRILMTRSSNGYKISQPSRTVETFFVKCIIKIPTIPINEKITHVVEPIFHEKGISSGAIIEFKIDL